MNNDDLVQLINVLVPCAQELLQKQGEFYPFAATVGRDGQAAMFGADIGVERPKSVDLIRFLSEALRAYATSGEIRAAGICFNTGARLPGYGENVDAICCQVEHVGGVANQLFVPYRKRMFGGFKFDKIVGLPGNPSIFGPSGIAE